jgi:hypothetical protein
MLDLMRENGAAVQDNLVPCECLLRQASENLKILQSELGEEELVKSVASELAKLTALKARSIQRQ